MLSSMMAVVFWVILIYCRGQSYSNYSILYDLILLVLECVTITNNSAPNHQIVRCLKDYHRVRCHLYAQGMNESTHSILKWPISICLLRWCMI